MLVNSLFWTVLGVAVVVGRGSMTTLRRQARSCLRGRHPAPGRSRSTPRCAAIRNSRRSFCARFPAIGSPHLTKMYAFWSSVMLPTGRYKGNPVVKHFALPRHPAGICSSAGSRFSTKPADELFDDCDQRRISGARAGADRRKPEARIVLSAGSSVAAGSASARRRASSVAVTGGNCIGCNIMTSAPAAPVFAGASLDGLLPRNARASALASALF